MNKVNSNWVDIQHETFTNWCNMIIARNAERSSDFVPMEDLVSGLRTGENLIFLAEQLTKKRCPLFKKRPTMQIHFLGNIEEALSMFSKDGVKMVNISAKEIFDGNLKLILGLMWTLIRHYESKVFSSAAAPSAQSVPQVSSDTNERPKVVKREESDHKKRLMEWIRSETGRQVKNFTSDFSDGSILSEIVQQNQRKFGLDPLIVHENDSATLRTTKAMEAARDCFHIPVLMKPIAVVQNPEELSMMTYLICMKGSLQEYEERWQDEEIAQETLRMQNMNMHTEQESIETNLNSEPQRRPVKLPPVPKLNKRDETMYQEQEQYHQQQHVQNQADYPYSEYNESSLNQSQQQWMNEHEEELRRTQQQFEDSLHSDFSSMHAQTREQEYYRPPAAAAYSQSDYSSGMNTNSSEGFYSSSGSSMSGGHNSEYTTQYTYTTVPQRTIVRSHFGFGFPFIPSVVTTTRASSQPYSGSSTVVVKKTVTRNRTLF